MGTSIEMGENSDSHKVYGEFVAIRKEKRELEKKADNIYRSLSDKDRKICDELIENENY